MASNRMGVRKKSARFGAPLDPQRNSLNFIRLILATLVLYAHSFFIIGRDPESQPQLGYQHLGVWAVAGFFAVSGYLITASRQRTGFADFLLLRIGRIFPAFIVCLLITAIVFGPIAQLITHGTLAGYLRTGPTPATYIFSNLFLEVHSYAIGSTLQNVPYPDAWNGSLWTLYYEFLCYLFVGVLLIWSRARTSIWPIASAFALSVILYANIDLAVSFVDGNPSFRLLSMLLPYFLGGALIRMLMPYLGLHWIPGSLSLILVIVSIQFGPAWIAQCLAPLLAYGLLWLSTAIPQPKWVARNDISYGLYVYAFPVQQLLALFGLSVLDPYSFSAVAFVIAGGLATVSWFVIERPALRRTRLAAGRAADRIIASVTNHQPALAETLSERHDGRL